MVTSYWFGLPVLTCQKGREWLTNEKPDTAKQARACSTIRPIRHLFGLSSLKEGLVVKMSDLSCENMEIEARKSNEDDQEKKISDTLKKIFDNQADIVKRFQGKNAIQLLCTNISL